MRPWASSKETNSVSALIGADCAMLIASSSEMKYGVSDIYGPPRGVLQAVGRFANLKGLSRLGMTWSLLQAC